MARPRIPTINWRSELAQLDRFLSKEGGVVHIRTTSGSPSSAFAKALRSLMEYGSWEKSWQTIQIDGNNAATHYFIDMVNQFERTLGIDSDPTTSANTTVTIGSNIVAGGDVDISDVHVHIPHNGANLHDRSERICSTISKLSETQRLGVFVLGADEEASRELSAFRSMLWDKRLENRVSDGLLLIAFIDQNGDVPDWLPDADEVIDLPDFYSEKSGRHAIEDLKNYFILQKLFPTDAEAGASALSMVSQNPSPKDLLAELSASLSRMVKWR